MKGLLLAVIICLGGCRSLQHSYEPDATHAPEAVRPQIVFFTFHMSKDSLKENTIITLVSSERAEGKMKSQGIPGEAVSPESIRQNQVNISLLNDKNEILVSSVEEHPLVRAVEATNEKGEFVRKMVSLTEADFFVRIPLSPGGAVVRVEEILNGKRIHRVDFNIQK